MSEETYLGDGLYVSYQGNMYKLRAPREFMDHEVFLDPEVLDAFLSYVNIIREGADDAQRES